MNLIDVLAMVGAITGPLGFVISLLVYFRDRAVVRVSLQYDMQGYGGMPVDQHGYMVITIYNVGRRPIYLSHAHMPIPKDAIAALATSHILIERGLQGVTIPEGGAPHIVHMTQLPLAQFATIWPRLRAAVVDAAGRTHYSDWPTKKPDWAGDIEASRSRMWWNRVRNRLRRSRR